MMAPSLVEMVWMMTKSAVKNGVTVLIVAKPGPLREGVQALVGAMPQVGTICEIDDLSSMLITDTDGCPGLVLLSCGKEVVRSMIERVKAQWPRSRCVTLVSSVEQQREAELAGADAVVLNGLPPQKLLKTIAGMLSL
jgi:DNA-binding NarL/FixJ family response regulator